MMRAVRVVVALLLGVCLLGPGTVSAKEDWADRTVRGVLELMIASLPPDIQVSYDTVTPDVRAGSFAVSGLRIRRKQPEIDSLGTLGELQVTGVDVLAAVSGKPFAAKRVAVSSLRVTEQVHRAGQPVKNTAWSVGQATFEDASIPSILSLARDAEDPERALSAITFRKGRMDGRTVRTVADVTRIVKRATR
ncbi:MAG: hypothetical protein ABT940_07430 [Alphaproteobacteria bacterium]